MDRRLAAFLLLLLGGCTALGGLTPGRSDLADVERTMGAPALSWRDGQGQTYLAYPRGPMGYQTWMVLLDPVGKLERIENALDEHHFALIKPGMTQEQVLHAIGPSYAPWTVYYPARDELAWEWRYCDAWQEASRFDVLFDGTRQTVRSTLSLPELCGRAGNCAC
jgi:hypothetical protein